MDYEKIVEEAWPKSADDVCLPYECWEQLKGETGHAFSAFCVYRDFGTERSIKKAFKAAERNGSYKQWCNWSAKYKWAERAAAFDRENERFKQSQLKKRIEEQIEKQFEVTGQLLDVAGRKLTLMNPDDLTQSGVVEFINIGIKYQREIAGLSSTNTEDKQGVITFVQDFQGL